MAVEAHTVLMLGSSGMVWTDTGPSGTLTKLVEAELSRRLPGIGWLCESEEIPPARDMPDRVRAAVEAHRPSAVVLAVSASYFTYDYVVARVRKRWPWLFRFSRSLSEGIKAASGGGFQGSHSPRGLLFRAPRALAEGVVGAEPYMKVENAIANTRAALEYLADQPGLLTVCKLPTMSADLPPDRADLYRARLDRFNGAICDVCEDRRIPYYELRQAAAADGLEVERVDDGIHSTMATRVWDAAYIAGLILERLGVPRAPPSRA